ncbi:hypothetical protein QTP86_018112 [Hemibagrus guttatus]|nr:hypothetical protein QTP86_018112 [Hemibagrus guttatus]
MMSSLSDFTKHFREVFGRPEWDSSLGERLCRLKQGNMSVAEYAFQFRTLTAASGWNEQALITTYRQGLEPRVRLHLAAYEDSMGLEKFIQLSIRFATRMQLCLEEHQSQPAATTATAQSGPVSHPEPADDTMQLELSDVSSSERQWEWQRRLAQNRCFYCWSSGHFMAKCPLRPTRALRAPRLWVSRELYFRSPLLPAPAPDRRHAQGIPGSCGDWEAPEAGASPGGAPPSPDRGDAHGGDLSDGAGELNS